MSTQPTSLQAPPDTPRPIWSRKSIVVPLTVAILIFSWLYGQTVVQSIRTFATDTWHCLTTECNPKGPAASWQELIAAADDAAHKVDSLAILETTSAIPAAYKFTHWDNNDALEITFNYVLTTGESLHVHLLDTTPSNVWTTQSTSDSYSDRTYYMESAKQKPAIETALAHIVLSPRQAIEATLTEVRSMEQSSGKEVRPHVHFYPFSFIEGTTNSQNWYADYSLYLNGKYDNSNMLLWPMFAVETSTGAIENISMFRKSPTLTP
ncbi:MAG: hypothetical protein ABIQ44_12695 [Chloroflexia bacterium]